MLNYLKGTRVNITRKYCKKGHYQGNQFTDKCGEGFGPSTSDGASASEKKLKTASSEDIRTNSLHG